MFGRRNVKTRQDLVRAEFGESLNLFKQAAAHAAGGLGASVGPSLGLAKETAMNKTISAKGAIKPAAGRIANTASSSWDSTLAAFAPLADAAKQGSARAAKLDSKKKNNNKKDDKGTKVLTFTTTTTTETESSSHTGLYALLATGVAVGAAGALVARRRTRAKWAEYEPGSLHSDASSFIGTGATDTKTYGEPSEGMAEKAGGSVSKATTWTKDHAKSAVDTVRGKIHDATADRSGEKVEITAVETTSSEKVNEGTAPMSGKSEAKHNAATPSGGSATNTSAASSRGSGTSDQVDDLIRSSKNGRM